MRTRPFLLPFQTLRIFSLPVTHMTSSAAVSRTNLAFRVHFDSVQSRLSWLQQYSITVRLGNEGLSSKERPGYRHSTCLAVGTRGPTW